MNPRPRHHTPSGQGWQATAWASRPGYQTNEDAAAVTDHALIVVDGATGLDKAHITAWPSDAQWFSHRLVALLREQIEDVTTSISDILQHCLHVLHAEFTRTAGSPVTATQAQPSASVIIARTRATVLEIYSLGDCQALIGHHDGSVNVCHDHTVEALDNAVVDTMTAWARKHHTTNKEARPHITDHLIRNRRLMNTPNGYWIADLTGVGIPHGCLETFDIAQVQDLALMTDGFAATEPLVHLFDTPTHLLHALRTTSPEPILDTLFALLDADPDYATYPRLKHIDDSTVIYATLPRR